ncbi:MAG: MlaD family protein [Solirubrobacterales bacterium]|nr:MlaD family protein [Solirubrobacterales bacterium]
MLVGAVTTIIAVVGVFFSYNANMGLPFVPTYRINAELPTGASLVKGNEVRIAGVRVGIVNSVKARQLANGRTIAKLDLKLDKSAQPVPVNSTITVRQRSAMGLKYLLLTPGDSAEGLKSGGTIPLRQATPETVDMDQWFNMFQPDVRRAIQRNLAEYGGMFAARGDAVNEILGDLPPLLKVAEPVTRNLSSKQTDLEGFIEGLSQAAAEVAPVADQQAEMFVALNTTFDALAEVARPYMQDSITEGVKTQLVIQREAPRIRPFLNTSARFMKAFYPGAKALGESAPIVSSSFDVGIPVLNSSPRLYNELAPTARSLRQFGASTQVNRGIDTLINTSRILKPLLAYVGPAQNVCNYLALTLRNVPETMSMGNANGRWVRAISTFGPLGPNAEAVPSAAPASGGGINPDAAGKNFLHSNPYPWTASPGQPRACAAGNETYQAGRQVIGNEMGSLATPVDMTEGQSRKQLNWGKGQ